MGRSMRVINNKVTDSSLPPQNLKRERDDGAVVKRITMFWPVSLAIINGGRKRSNNIQGRDDDLSGIMCEEAEEFFYTAMRFKKTTKKVVDIAPENISSLCDVIDDQSAAEEDTTSNSKRLTFCQPRDKKVDLFVPKTRGGGKRLECTPYYQVLPTDDGSSRFIQVDESKPDMLRAHANMFLVRRENKELVREFFECKAFEEYNEESESARTTAVDFLIFMRRQVSTPPMTSE